MGFVELVFGGFLSLLGVWLCFVVVVFWGGGGCCGFFCSRICLGFFPPIIAVKIAPLNLYASGIDRSKASKSHYTRLHCYCIDNNTLSEQLTHSHKYAEITVVV